MKTTRHLFLAGMMAILGCSIADAQFIYTNSLVGATLIYSNGFDKGAVNITNTTPDFSTNVLGGSLNPLWIDTLGTADNGVFNADGTITSTKADSITLPFTPRSNYVYTLTATFTLSGNPGNWFAAGFGSIYGVSSSGGFNQNLNAYDFAIFQYLNANSQYFNGRSTANQIGNINGAFSPVTGAPHTATFILDTTTVTNWTIAAYIDGRSLLTWKPGETTFTFTNVYSIPGTPTNWASSSTSPTNIASVALGQNSISSPSYYVWNSMTLSAAPIVIGQQPVSTNISVGTAFTNTVTVAATAPAYQWYKNSAPIANATNASLIFNPVTVADISTNYYVVVSNSFGSITSVVATLGVYTNPVFLAAYPVGYTTPLTLFGGSGGTHGSSPTFSVSTAGGQPISYRWLANGAPVAGQTNASFTFTNCQLSSPTSFACVASNSYGMTTNAWAVTYVAAPTAPYAQAVLSDQPSGYWRLNEGEVGGGDNGVLALDYGNGDNGLYTNVYLGNSGYSPSTDSGDTSPLFGSIAATDCGAFGIQGVDFAAPTGASAEFSVAAWVNGFTGQPNNAGIVTKGYGGAEQFVLDVYGGNYRFSVRDASGNNYSAVATVGPDGTWQHVVGVCDEANGVIAIYVNGLQSGSATITSGSGLLSSSSQMSIGARSSSATANNDWQFSGYINDVAVFNYALTTAQAANLYSSIPGNSVPLSFVPPLPPTNVVYQANTTLTIPATAYGGANAGYYWADVTTATILASGSTNVQANLNATLTIPNASGSLSGDQLELVVTNATSSTNWFVSLFSPAAPVRLDYSSPILYSNSFNGGTWNIAGQSLTAANALVGGTNTTWTDVLGVNDTGAMQASGIPTATKGDCWLVPFTPEPGYIYTATYSVTLKGNPGTWIAMGFTQNLPMNSTSAQFNNSGPTGYNWVLINYSGNVEYFAGPNGGANIVNATLITANTPATHTVTLSLDTTGSHWKVYGFIDGTPMGTNTYASNPTIGAVGIGQNGTESAPQNIQWNSFSLTQTGPNGGLPPYAYNPVPPTSVTLLADSALSIPTTAFGDAPFGYQWSNTNTAAVLGSGVTNSTVPISADLNVADVPFSWNGDKLALVVTNAYGTNIYLVSLTVTNLPVVPFTNSPSITGFSIANGTNVVINATNGDSGAIYYLLSSTNLAIPASQWLPLATNVIVTNGNAANGFTFVGTNVVSLTNPQQFYMLGNTN